MSIARGTTTVLRIAVSGALVGSSALLLPSMLAASAPPEATPGSAPVKVTSRALSDALIPNDPALVMGQLDNGMHYIVKKHDKPAGRAVVWVHMHTGSLNETERQRGIAHYLEHMAFNGSEHFKPGSLVPFFESLGMTFGRDQNAFTNFDQTTYQLSLPKADTDTLAQGMTFFKDVVGALSLLPSEIDDERQIIQEERRRGLSGRQRIGDMTRERLAPGSLYAKRIPIGTEETINSVQQSDFKDYYNKWYGASNATLIVVADADPNDVVKVIKEQFGSLPKRPRPTPQSAGVKAYDHSFAIVATDPEVRGEDLSITFMEPPRPVVTTEGQYRDELVERLGTASINRRFGEKSATGGTSYQNARCSISNSPMMMREVSVSARPMPGKWQAALNEIALEVQRARAFGFTQHEIGEVRKGMISGAEQAVETEPTAQASAFMNRMNSAVANGEPITTPKQRLDLLNKYLPTITAEEVSSRFAHDFDLTNAAFVLTLKSGDGVPTEDELLAAGVKALKAEPTREKEREHATQLLVDVPTPGKIVEPTEHDATEVWSAWLSNNVRVHHRFMNERANEVSVSIALIGGELLEDDTNKGITNAAQLAFGRPATKHLSSTDIRELMNGKKVSTGGAGGGFGRGGGGGRGRGGGGGGGGGGAVNLSISGAPEDLESGFQLAYLLLTEPKIEQTAFDQFVTSAREGLEMSQTGANAVGARTVASIIYPDSDPRTRPLEARDIDRLKLDAAQAWLEKLIKESPIEVTIVGDIDREKVMPYVARYLGSLPMRPRVDTTTYESSRHLKRPAGARVAEKIIDSPTKKAFVYVGFYGTDESKRDDVRALNTAARIMSMRMVKEVREEAQLVYSMGATSRAANLYPGFGTFSASAPTDPAKAHVLVDKIKSMYDEFAANGPTEEELATAKKQWDTTRAEEIKQPNFWSGRLGQMTFRGAKLDDIINDPKAYAAITTAQVKDAFNRYYTKDNLIQVLVSPKTDDATSATAPGGN